MRKKAGVRRRREKKSAEGDGIRIYISPVMLVMAVYFAFTGMMYEFFCSLAAVMLHECAHAKVARKLGYELNVIKLMPYGAALCGSADMRAKDEAAVAVAGPLFNLATSALFAALWWLVPSSYMFTQAFCTCSLYIGLFNLLPVYPLDGGRILYAVLARKTGHKRALKIMRIVSVPIAAATVAVVIAATVYSFNPCLVSVGSFVTVSALLPDKSAMYKAVYSPESRILKLTRPTEVRRIAVIGSVPVSQAVKALDPERYSEFVVLDDKLHVIGVTDEARVITAAKEHGYDISMNKVMLKTGYK